MTLRSYKLRGPLFILSPPPPFIFLLFLLFADAFATDEYLRIMRFNPNGPDVLVGIFRLGGGA